MARIEECSRVRFELDTKLPMLAAPPRLRRDAPNPGRALGSDSRDHYQEWPRPAPQELGPLSFVHPRPRPQSKHLSPTRAVSRGIGEPLRYAARPRYHTPPQRARTWSIPRLRWPARVWQ